MVLLAQVGQCLIDLIGGHEGLPYRDDKRYNYRLEFLSNNIGLRNLLIAMDPEYKQQLTEYMKNVRHGKRSKFLN